MKKNIFLLLCTSCMLTTGTAQNLMPLPQEITYDKGYFKTGRPYQVKGKEYLPKIFQHHLHSQNAKENFGKQSDARSILLFKKSPALPPEAYQLHVGTDTVQVVANGPAGFQYAWTTLQQLRQQNKIPCCTISDYPAYAWRGAMIDVSRHFFPIAFLKKQIDVLASYKINRLHLHLTDAAGWRMEIKRYPRLCNFAAWRTNSLWKDWWNGGRKYVEENTPGAYGGYYTQEELRDLVKYASDRNIMVIPEIEMPAHSEEVLTAYPELSCTHEPYKQADFCPGSIATYDFLENVLKEVMAVFPAPYIHVGGDEAAKTSWKSCPLCQKKMRENQLEEIADLQTHLINHFADFLKRHGRQLIGWDEIAEGELPQGTPVMIWRDAQKAISAIEKGYDVVLSPASHCYLDAYQDAPDREPEAIGGFLTLEKVYQFNPLAEMTDVQKAHVKGVQGNLWTEYVPTAAHAEHMLYPRMLAIAEIAWNGTAHKDYEKFHQRALQETQQLREAGIDAFDLSQEIGDRPAALRPVKHKALHAQVTYNQPVSPYYKGAGATTLTDGIMGGWHHGNGQWQGFIGKHCLDVTLDLGTVKSIKTISTDFLQNSRPDIFFPAHYKISISKDGRHFTSLYEKEHKVNMVPYVAAEEWSWRGKAKARFIRIEAGNGEKGGWIFTDEIKVY